MSKFKIGDLALIVGCNTNPKNLGKVVELIAWVAPGEIFHGQDGRKYLADTDQRDGGWIVQSENFISRDRLDWGWVEERHLMPLKGDFQPEQQKAKEEIA